MKLEIGLNAISSYRRMDYTIWYALAEFVDNSTQSYFDNKVSLDKSYQKDEGKLEVNITYDRDEGVLRVSDNAMGMNEAELERALRVAVPPASPFGRCRYGMGMKTAACWIGNAWSIKTKRLGATTEITVQVSVDDIASGDPNLAVSKVENLPPEDHYTILEITKHNRPFKGRTIGKIKDHLRSMYRVDLSAETLSLKYNGESLEWEGLTDLLRQNKAGERLRTDFEFDIEGKSVTGWAGILERGARADAGFSILHSSRVVKGWPDSWRPEKIFGQNRNDLLNQRLVGEINLDSFEVTHTKDGIQWYGDEEFQVEKVLHEKIADLVQIARTPWKDQDDEDLPGDAEVEIAIEELNAELNSPEMVDQIQIDTIPEEDLLKESITSLTEPLTEAHQPELTVQIADLLVWVYIVTDLSPNDPYVMTQSGDTDKIIVIINLKHPHIKFIDQNSGLLNYFRHCVYDAIAEWQAMKKTGKVTPETVKSLKDKLLRVSFEMEQAASVED